MTRTSESEQVLRALAARRFVQQKIEDSLVTVAAKAIVLLVGLLGAFAFWTLMQAAGR